MLKFRFARKLPLVALFGVTLLSGQELAKAEELLTTYSYGGTTYYSLFDAELALHNASY